MNVQDDKNKHKHVQKIAIQEEKNANKQVRSHHWTYVHRKSKFHFAIFWGGRNKNIPSLKGNLLESVHVLRLTHGEEERLEDVDVRFERHNMALNGAASNDGSP